MFYLTHNGPSHVAFVLHTLNCYLLFPDAEIIIKQSINAELRTYSTSMYVCGMKSTIYVHVHKHL